MRMLALAIIALVTISPAWAQQTLKGWYEQNGTGTFTPPNAATQGTANNPVYIAPMPAPEIYQQPAPKQNWNDNLGMKPGWNPKPATNAWERALGTGGY
jgi:hypothetical protein